MKLTTKEIIIFAMLGTIMYVSKLIMELAPNIHLLAAFTITFTVVYRKKALYPIYIFVFLSGLFNGFSLWWIPYLYIWTILWAITMVLSTTIPNKYQSIVYMIVASLHGFLYGVLYAPAQMLLFGFNFQEIIAWIIAGFPFDIIHGISNFFCGLLIMPLIKILKKLN